MATYRTIRSTVASSLEEVPPSVGIAAAGAANAAIGIEAGISIASAYGKATAQGSASRLQSS